MFLFFNRISKEFNVFQMQESSNHGKAIKTHFLRQVLAKLKEDINQTFKFILIYKLDFNKSHIYKYVLEHDM